MLHISLDANNSKAPKPWMYRCHSVFKVCAQATNNVRPLCEFQKWVTFCSCLADVFHVGAPEQCHIIRGSVLLRQNMYIFRTDASVLCWAPYSQSMDVLCVCFFCSSFCNVTIHFLNWIKHLICSICSNKMWIFDRLSSIQHLCTHTHPHRIQFTRRPMHVKRTKYQLHEKFHVQN